MPTAQGRFEVRRTPQGPLELGDTQAMHMRFDKTFEGPLVATSGGLTGLRGSMRIDITDGAHFYRFDYELPPA